MFSFFETFALPSLESGLVALRTSGSAFSALTVSSIGVLNFDAVIFSPLGAVSTTGLIPLACEGKRSLSRSVAAWLSVPGSVRLSLTSVPIARDHPNSATKISTQTPSTIQRRRTHSFPNPYNRPVMQLLLVARDRASCAVGRP